MIYFNKACLIVLAIILSACAKDVGHVKPIVIQKSIPIVSRPINITAKPVKVSVISKGVNEPDFDVYVAMSIKDYINLSYNIQDVIRFIKEQNAIIEYYEDSYYIKPLEVQNEQIN